MAATGSITVSGSITGLPAGSKTIGPLTISAAAALGQQIDVVLAAGANTISVPAAATAAIIIFASASTTAKTLKGIAGDTGIPIAVAGKVVLNLTAGGASSFVINAVAADTGNNTSILFI